MGSIQSEVQHQQVYQQVEKERETPSNAVEVSSTIIENVASMQFSFSFVTEQIVNQPNQQWVSQEQLRNSAFILEEIGEHSREGTRPLIIEKWENNMSHCQDYKKRFLKITRE
ncbi:hypothetical protein RND71_021815 [Anisodus tanguticus]|uniref:Uncharacterized protein n=1 Tax=Anisodus tanguticus TaxID=243964 RepID=A0AAE1RZ59_9SOLA|nr:hypothetical protein RND71_021815 [Anisodus tanguticus]